MKNAKLIAFIPLLLIIGFLVINSYYTLENAEQAVIERLGEVVDVETSSGLHFKIPFVDRVYVVNTNEVISLQYGYRPVDAPTSTSVATYENNPDEQIVLTKGSYLLNIGAVIQYRITDPQAYLYNVDDQEDTIRLAFETVLRRNMQNKELDDALINKEIIADEISPELSLKLSSYGLGIAITDVQFTDVLLPTEVQYAYDNVNIAENEKDAYQSKADKYTNENIPAARADAYKLVQDAEGYKAKTVAQAIGDVENFNQVYEKYSVAKEITTTRLYLEAMESVLENVTDLYIVDLSSDDGVLQFLPLDQTSSQGVQ